MVSQQNSNLFLQAVERLDGKKPLGSLDELLESFGLNYETALSNENFVKVTIWNLAPENPFSNEYKTFLLEVNPHISSRYLVGALIDFNRRDVVEEILLQYGPSQYTVRPLVGALRNPVQREPALEILLQYGPIRETVNPLVGALIDSNRRDVVEEILLQYGPSQYTVRPLVGSLRNPVQREHATNILVSYGKYALQFIREPIPGTNLYEPLSKVIDAIKRAA